jgi:hypothetical protein
LDTARETRKYVLRLSEELIRQDVCHRPFESGLIHFLAALGIKPDTLRLRTAPECSSLLGSLVYCVRVLTTKAFLPSEQCSKQGAAETRSLRSQHLVDGLHSSMTVMLSLLSKAKFLLLRTPGSGAGSMWWSLDCQTFFTKGLPVELALPVLWHRVLSRRLGKCYGSRCSGCKGGEERRASCRVHGDPGRR